VEFAVDERVGWGESLRWARTKWFSYFGAPMFPAIVVVAIVLPLAFLGLLMRFTAGAWLVGLLWPLVLVGGLLVVILLLGVVFGWPLMWATISAEGTDSFDALSRVFAYVFHRPLRYLFYAIVAAVIGWLGWLLVANVAVAIIWLAAWAASWGSGDIALANTGLIRFWTGWVKWLAMGYSYAYFWTASTTIYFLLRQDVDATELDEVYREADESEKDFGLPPLATEEEKGEGGAKAEGGRRKAEGGGENAESP
jgi:hypothetical protein